MSNRFLRQRNVTAESTGVNFINPTINAQEIVHAGTSGNKMVDMAFDTAIKMATKLEHNKRVNELSQAELTANNNIKEYETQWTGVNKFSDENYAKYMEGLNEVMTKNKGLLENTRFTKKEDIDKWDLNMSKTKSNLEFTALGQKNQYDIKDAIGKTTLNAEGLSNLSAYETDPSKSNDYLTQSLKSLDTLKGFVDEVELLKMKTNIVNKTTSTRLENQIQDVMNSPNYSLEQKMTMISDVKSGISNSAPYKQTIDGLVKSGAINKADAETMLNNNKAYIEEYSNKADGMINRLNGELENQRYQEEQKTLTAERQLQKNYTDEMLSVDSNIRSGNNNIAISKVEGQPFTPDEIMANSVITKKYWGDTTENIIGSGQYISVISTTETSRMNNEIKIAMESGATRATALENVITYISKYPVGSTERQNIERNLVARGVISSYEIQLYTASDTDINMINNISSVSDSVYKKFDYASVSKYNTGLSNKLGELSDPMQMAVAQKALIGAMSTGEINIGAGNKPNATSLNLAYRDPKNKAVIDSIIERAKQLSAMPIKEATPKREAFKSAIDSKYRSKEIVIKDSQSFKRKEVERPIDYEVDNYLDNILDD